MVRASVNGARLERSTARVCALALGDELADIDSVPGRDALHERVYTTRSAALSFFG